MKLQRIALCLLAAAALAVSAGADTHPNLQTGFAAGKSFQVGDVDHVNGFNGNLVVTIPIGPNYLVGGEVSYGLTLVFNSNPWLYQESCGTTCRTQAIPNPGSDAGFGWTLSLGRLLDGTAPQNGSGDWLYVGPDGSEHSFAYQTLHDNETGGTSNVRYTRDGSYLRLKVTTREVEFPNGVIHKFKTDGDLDEMRDRFGNKVTLAKPTNLGWTLTDTPHNRVQYINYVSDPDPILKKRLSSIVLTAFNGSTTTYTFGYQQMSVARPCDSDQSLGNLSARMLTSVTAADSTGTLAVWSMPSYQLTQSGGYCKGTGSILRLVLPTQGQVGWTYRDYEFPQEGNKVHRRRSNGVASRTLYDAAGVPLGPSWLYTTALRQYMGTPSAPMEIVNTVTDPLGNKTESFFSVALNDFNPPWKLVEYGLPLARLEPDGTGNRFVSTKNYAGATSLVRSSYVNYEVDAGTGFGGTVDQASKRNQRLVSTRTVFNDDLNQSGVPRYADVDLSNFDGLGHYRVTQSGVGFDTSALRTETTDFNSGRGTYPGSFTMLLSSEKWILDTYASQEATEAGKTARRTFSFDTDGWLERTRLHSSDTGAAAGNDVVVETLQTAGNLSSERYYGGGDLPGTLGTGPLATLTLPAAQYRIDYTTLFGTRATATYMDAGGSPLTFKSLEQTIDMSTGLVASSVDTSGITTTYEYDGLGRLRFAKPQAQSGHGDAWTEYVYTRATGAGALARVDITQQPNGGGTPLTQSTVKFDVLGRVWQEQELMPNDTWSTRETLYNAMGWKQSVSELGNTAKRTTYSGYDPFGRPGTVNPPDGSGHNVTFVYAGARSVARSVNVADTQTTEHPAWTTELYDRQGRLSEVREEAQGSYPTFTNSMTTYTYDAGNRLARVQQQTSAGNQDRWFIYDQRGFLLREQHPEKGAGGNGLVIYESYDSRGHAGRKKECSSLACNASGEPKADLTFSYDRAERVTSVTQAGVGILKSFTYGTSNAANERTNGRLRVATRYNYVSPPFSLTLQADETYTYAGGQGRPSRRVTTSRIGTAPPDRTFDQTWTYDPLGNVTGIGYPNCTFAVCPSVPRTVSQVYTKGRLTEVTGFASSITYHPNGMVNQVTHVNGVLDTQAADPNGMARPASLAARRTGTTSDLWATGTYLYDGAANVKKMGNAYFLYDHVSRLIDGHVYDGPTGGGQQRYQTYTYDPFGNLLGIGGDSFAPGRSTPTSAVTNRHTGAAYDVAGNMVGFNGATYDVDGFGMMIKMVNGAEDWRYIYTAGDERLLEYRNPNGGANWALRDLDGKVLREFQEQSGWAPREYFYRGGQLLASSFTPAPPFASEGGRHFSVDHLGTPRLVTAAGGHVRSVWTGGDSSCVPAPGDYDRDGDSDLALLCNNAFHFYRDDGSYLGGIWTGAPTYIPVPADYDGDGDDDPASFDGGAWHIWYYNDNTQQYEYHGVWTGTSPGCVPAPADYDGDGNADLSLKCGQEWHFYNDNGSFIKKITTGDTANRPPVPGDYNGDGRDDPALSNGAAWDIWDYVSGNHTTGIWTGATGTPIAMDYDGDGTADPTVFNAGAWHIYRHDGSYDQGVWIAAGVTPVRGNFTGDRAEEPAVYSGGAWSIYSFAGMPIARHHYFPFGEELSSTKQDVEQMKFTGHERDFANTISVADDLDYMHARYYNPLLGRFLSTDRVHGSGGRPQSFNRYSYAWNNPLKHLDPDGNVVVGFTGLGNDPLGGMAHAFDRLLPMFRQLGGVHLYDHQGTGRAAMNFVLDQHKRNPDKPIALFGHSLGAYSALWTASNLAKDPNNPRVDLLIMVDAAPNQGRERVPSNVTTAVNFYQSGADLGGTQMVAADPSKTTVWNVQLNAGHTNIDDVVAASIVSMISNLAQQGDPNLKEGLQFVQGALVRVTH